MSDKEYSLEELNYFRVCYITTNIIRDGLQTVFKQEWDRVYKRFGKWKDTARNGQDFFNMESRKSRKRNKRLLNIIQRGNTSEWDCTCFFFALLHSDSFGPALSPTVASNVDDLRVFRNAFFGHYSEASILEADFQTNVQLVTNSFTALHLDTKDLQRIINQKSFPTGELQKLREQILVLEEEIQAEPKTFMILPCKPSHKVTERKVEVEDIMKTFMDLQNANDDCAIVTVYVSGNPGCGKSQIARQVGETFAADNHDGGTFVMTLNAESEQSMLDSYKKFARAVGVTEYSLASISGGDSKLTKEEQISHLKTLVSAKVQNYSSWLLIFDNVEELVSLRGCWPEEEGWGDCGQVLVTTQDSSNLPFGDPSCQHVSLSQGMQTNDALSLLRSICQFSSDEDEEHLVLNALDYQPLAIACAALYVRYLYNCEGTGIPPGNFTWKSYLKKLEMGKRNSTERVYERTSRSYPFSMTSAVSLALQKLVQHEVLEHVVPFLALSAPAPIGLDILVNFVTKQDPDLDKDMTAAEISKCSLLMHFSSDDSPRNLIKLHQVVHDVFLTYFIGKFSNGEVSVLTQAYIETLSVFAEHDMHQFDLKFHLTSKMMAPHLKVFSSHLEKSNRSSSNTNQGSLHEKAFLNFGDICSTHGFLPEAKTYFESALQIANDEGKDSDVDQINLIAEIQNSLGVVYWKLGQFRQAEHEHQHALALLESINPGNPTPEISDSLNKLGNVSFSLSQFEAARDYFWRSKIMREELYGEDNAIVAASLNNLASVHSALGDHRTAESYYQRSLDLAIKTYGEVHPHVADCLCNLGIVYSELGSSKKAIEYHTQALEMRKALFLPDHFLISESYNNLGLMYKSRGQLEQAMSWYESALRIREKILDEEHPAMAELLSNLGQLYMDLGEMEKSKDFHFRAQNIRRDILKCGHCKLGDSMFNLGMVHEQCSELDKAAYYFEHALNIYAKSYPISHQLCQSADEGFKRVTQQLKDLNDQRESSARPDSFTSCLRSSMVMAVEESKILIYPFVGAHWGRLILLSRRRRNDSELVIIMIKYLVLILMTHYVKYYVCDTDMGHLKSFWYFIPYLIWYFVTFEIILEGWHVLYDSQFQRVLKFFVFLYFLGYFFKSYL